jgi:hypothetical protein
MMILYRQTTTKRQPRNWPAHRAFSTRPPADKLVAMMQQKFIRRVGLAAILVSFFLFSCATIDSPDDGATPPPPANPAGAPPADPLAPAAIIGQSGCPRAVVTSGLGLGWERLNHRVSLWDIHPAWDACPAGLHDTRLEIGFVGGNWSTGQTFTDTPLVRYRHTFVAAPGNIAFAQIAVPLELFPPNHTASAEATFGLATAKLDGFAHHDVFLQGFAIDTDVPQTDPDYPDKYEPGLGFTPRGLTASVGDLRIGNDEAVFTVTAGLPLGPADRSDMNAAMPHARMEATVYVVVVGFNDGAITDAEHGYVVEQERPWFLFQPNYPHAASELRRFSIAGREGYPVAFLALRGFSFALYGDNENADYLRELSALATLLDYDPATGRAVVDLDGYASNVGLLTYEQLETDFKADIALVQLPGGLAIAGALDATFDTGETDFTLP